MKFPHYFTTEVKNKETGEKEPKEFQCVGTAYIAEKTGIPSRTIRWRAKQGLIPKTKRMGVEKNGRIVYFWLTQQADAYCAAVNSLADLHTASNDEFYNIVDVADVADGVQL